MFANTLNLNWGSTDHTFVRINQDKYSSEYRYTEPNGDKLRLFIRHTTFVSKTDKVSYDRHNVEVSYEAKVDGAPNERKKVYVVFETPSDSNIDSMDALYSGLTFLVNSSGFLHSLVNGES